jgi:hypothetical protein
MNVNCVRRWMMLTRKSLLAAVGVAMVVLFAATEVRGQTDDTNGNGLPDVCTTAPIGPDNSHSDYSIALNSVKSQTDGFDFNYTLTASNSTALQKISRLVFVFNRPLRIEEITSPLPSDWCVPDTPSKAGTGNCNNFVASIPVDPGEALTIPFTIRSTTGRRGLITINVDTGSSGLLPCMSRPNDPEGPMGIEGPGSDVNPDAVVATATTYTTGNCFITVNKNLTNMVTAITATPPCTLVREFVQLSEIEVLGMKLVFIGTSGDPVNDIIILRTRTNPDCYLVCPNGFGACQLYCEE